MVYDLRDLDDECLVLSPVPTSDVGEAQSHPDQGVQWCRECTEPVITVQYKCTETVNTVQYRCKEPVITVWYVQVYRTGYLSPELPVDGGAVGGGDHVSP